MDNIIELNAINQIIEVSQMDELTGRSPMKLILHEIYPDTSKYNLNGISWNRQYTENNKDTAINMPIVCQFLDENNEIPVGHGEYEIVEDNDNQVIFKDSVVVGTITNTYIDNVLIDNVSHEVLIGEGCLYNERFPNFVNWLKDKMTNEKIKSSIEIGKKAPNTEIVYDGGYKELGRIPQIYCYTATAILYLEKPADESAIILEVNNQKEVKKVAKKKVNKKIEINELALDDIFSIITDEFNEAMTPSDWTNNWDYREYWLYKAYQTYVIMQNWDDSNVYYKVPYSISADGKVIMGQAVRVEASWNDVTVDPNAEPDEEDENAPIKVDLSAVKTAMMNKTMNNKGGKMMEENEKKVQELNSKIEELNKKVEELNSTIVEVNKTLESEKTEKAGMVEELNSLRADKVKVDAEKKQKEVNSYFESEIKKNGFTEVELNSLKADYVDKSDLEGLKNAEKELCVKKIKEMSSVNKSLETNSQDDLFVTIKNTEKSEEDYSDLF